uniref:Reverse transcriptase domain-containing protein n=1 Tax=Glossina palpalis gambiensis TaxID=67801 RepID=A0A1B0BAR8_9MUSC
MLRRSVFTEENYSPFSFDVEEMNDHFFLVNSVLAQSVFPLNWKRPCAVSMSKVKTVYFIDDLRPISILPATSKIVAHKGSDSCCCAETYFTVPIILTNTIKTNVNGSHMTSLAALDLSKVFNNGNRWGLIMKLVGDLNLLILTVLIRLLVEYTSGYTKILFRKWSLDNSLLINLIKSKAVLFGNANWFGSHLRIFIGISYISICLGICIDNNLTVEKYIKFIHGKVVGTLPSIYSNYIYLPQCIKFCPAHALVMPQVLYGTF